MSVERTYANHQTRYALRDGAQLSGVLTWSAAPGEPGIWKILRPGPGGTEDLYGTRQFISPDAAQLRAWLRHFVGDDRAAELAMAVDEAPPPTAGWATA
jgi:hypothetical protein